MKKVWPLITRFLAGCCMGVTGLIPGISSGTMAVVAGVYEPIVAAVRSLTTRGQPKMKPFFYLLFIGAGMVLATLVFAALVERVLVRYPGESSIFFIGLLLGTLPILYQKIAKHVLRPSFFLPVVLGFVAALFLGGGQKDLLADPMTETTVVNMARMLLAGFLSAGAGLVPGISGSMVLVLIGRYTSMLTAIKDFNLSLLLPMALGALLGFVAFARGIHYLLKNKAAWTYGAIIGLFIGAAVHLWPKHTGSARPLVWLIVAAGGFVLGLISYWFNRRRHAKRDHI